MTPRGLLCSAIDGSGVDSIMPQIWIGSSANAEPLSIRPTPAGLAW
jgi:hypothetical protein